MTHLLLAGTGLEEVRYYSEKIGDTTMKTETRTTIEYRTEAREGWTQGETRRRLFTEDELRRTSEESMLMLNTAMPPLILETTPYFKDLRIAHLANLPFHRDRVSQQPPASPQTPPNQPTPPPAQPPSAQQDRDQDDDQGNNQYFLQE